MAVVFSVNFAMAQNYKAPKIDASGKMFDKDGKFSGTINIQGEILDTLGNKLAYIDANGILIDAKSGKKLGKTEKNGNYVSYYAKTSDKGWTTSAPMNGTCLVKDKDGKVQAEVHENYKQYGACAIHCMQHNMEHGKVLEKPKTDKAVYTCPMHPEVISDQRGKCPKCNMDLVKK